MEVGDKKETGKVIHFCEIKNGNLEYYNIGKHFFKSFCIEVFDFQLKDVSKMEKITKKAKNFVKIIFDTSVKMEWQTF